MRTRKRSYASASDGITFFIRPAEKKRRKMACSEHPNRCLRAWKNARLSSVLDFLHDDLVISILEAVASTANSPSDLLNAMLTCKRFCAAAIKQNVLAKVSMNALRVRASKWSEGAHRFLKHCADAGNLEACYTLGMIRFYCMGNRGGGAALMARSAMASHAPALHSLAVIQFNGSGKGRRFKDLKAGVALCARAAALGHIDAIRELGHCLQDGYGVSKNIAQGRRLLLEATSREAPGWKLSVPVAMADLKKHGPSLKRELAHRLFIRRNTALDASRPFHQHIRHLGSQIHAQIHAIHHQIDALGSRSQNPAGRIRELGTVSRPVHAGSYSATRSRVIQAQIQAAHNSAAQLNRLVPYSRPAREAGSNSAPRNVRFVPDSEEQIDQGDATSRNEAGNRREIEEQAEEQRAAYYAQERLIASMRQSFCAQPRSLHIANKFLMEWFDPNAHPLPAGLRLCSHSQCGRPETRKHEFRRCSSCGSVNYCSRTCQALDWKARHKYSCSPVAHWIDHPQ